MSVYVLIIDLFGFILAVAGFAMAFRQAFVRRLLGLPAMPRILPERNDSGDDPLTYVLRIAGTMIMIFGIVIAGMTTMFHMAQS